MRRKRAIIASQRTLRRAAFAQGGLRRSAGVAEIPFGSAQGKLSLHKIRLLGMTTKVRTTVLFQVLSPFSLHFLSGPIREDLTLLWLPSAFPILEYPRNGFQQ